MTYLPDKYFSPFDRTYEDVTRRMKQKASTLVHPDQDWLNQLIDTFANARKNWNNDPDLELYRKNWLRLRSNMSRLTAGAYLHIVYDLSRTMADDWPGTGRWTHGPNLARGRQIYAEVETAFPESLHRVARQYGTVGYPFLFLRFIMPFQKDNIINWLLLLRSSAWEYADILTTAGNRHQLEKGLAKALGAALEDVSDFMFWKFAKLRAPNGVLYARMSPTIIAVLLGIGGSMVVIVLSAITSYLVSKQYARDQEMRNEDAFFVQMFAQLVLRYSEVAISSPEELNIYLNRARDELGLPPRNID